MRNVIFRSALSPAVLAAFAFAACRGASAQAVAQPAPVATTLPAAPVPRTVIRSSSGIIAPSPIVPVQGPALTVTGHAVVNEPADRAAMTVSVGAQGPDIETAMETARAAIAALQREAARVRSVRLQTSSLQLNTGFGYQGGAPTTYNVQGSVEFSIDDLSQLPAALKAAQGIPGAQAPQVRYDVRDRGDANARVLLAAAADARAQVDALAAKTGLKIVGVRSLQSYVNAPSSEQPSIRFETNATVTYDIAPAGV